ncbi:hypothetical protein K432DRAFT_400047 [Lepidopterella palustris CBS 459.81]|uniref:Extracellular membrane protein CFEM domain-containing protein n=1 Tax=Lepidopterella palustris CBS 459.81 TaxID=1314670 RepID=A0A8E2EKK9_9PEZI|nr:hypothetical protein K432DRAFT_400047 [Lepidopterella palustris CBS 459.81]
MRLPQQHQAIALLLSLWATSASAISLSNFTPRVENLPSACEAVYDQTIAGCQASDFATNAQCSKACINGLVAISQAVQSQCKDADVAETSIIGVFLQGQGIPSLCNGVTVTTVNSPGSTQATSSSQAKNTLPSSSSATSAAAKPSGGIIIDTSSSPTVSSTLDTSTSTSSQVISSAVSQASSTPANSPASTTRVTSSTNSAKASKTTVTQKSNPQSGGGSPFDVQAASPASLASVPPHIGLASILLGTLFIIH